MCASLHAHGASQFSLSTMWALGLELRSSHLLSHLTGLALCTFEIVPQTLKNEHLTKGGKASKSERGMLATFWKVESGFWKPQLIWQTQQSQIPLQNTESD